MEKEKTQDKINPNDKDISEKENDHIEGDEKEQNIGEEKVLQAQL